MRLNPFKRLASQTFIYGIPSIAGRFLNYLLTYLYTRVFNPAEFGVNAELYAYSGFFAVLLAFGLETGYFRFREESDKPELVFSTAFRFIVVSALTFLIAMLAFNKPLASLMHYEGSEIYLILFAFILALDAIGALPFAKLRAETKAERFAGIKLIEILVNIGLNLFFLVLCRNAFQQQSNEWLAGFYNPQIGVGYIFISNLAASAVKVLLLSPQLKALTAGFDTAIFKNLMRYSLPMVLIGFAGIVNEMLDRMSLKYLLPGNIEQNLSELGIYSACYKLSVVMTLFIQAFRYAAEPFFFAQAKKEDSRKIYADVLLYFTIFCVFIFLLVMLFLDVFKLFIGEQFREGLQVVPVLLVANIFLGIYTNLSIWYKLTDKTLSGAMVSVAGAVLTIVLLFALVPRMGYMGAAWATFLCYFFMAVVSYMLGQRFFPVPYNLFKVLGYMVFGIALWQLHVLLQAKGLNFPFLAHLLLAAFAVTVSFFEKKRNVFES